MNQKDLMFTPDVRRFLVKKAPLPSIKERGYVSLLVIPEIRTNSYTNACSCTVVWRVIEWSDLTALERHRLSGKMSGCTTDVRYFSVCGCMGEVLPL